MSVAMDLVCGTMWSIVYILAIVFGIRSKVCCIPKIAVCFNFSWELLVVLERLQKCSYGLGFAIQLVWLTLDIGVLVTMFVYGRRGWHVLKSFILLVAVGICCGYLISCFGFQMIAFATNAIMSLAFIIDHSLYTRPPDSWIFETDRHFGRHD